MNRGYNNDFSKIDGIEMLKTLEESAHGYDNEIINRIIKYAEYLPLKLVAELMFKACHEMENQDYKNRIAVIAAKWYTKDE